MTSAAPLDPPLPGAPADAGSATGSADTAAPGVAGSVIAAPAVAVPVRAVGRRRVVLRAFARRPTGVIGLAVLLLLFLAAYLGPHLTQWSYDRPDFENFLSPPSGAHWFGTNQIGDDVFAQTMRGLQKSLVIGLLAGVLGTAIAAAAGTAAGYFGGWTDRAMTWLIDLLLVVPSFLIIAVLSPLYVGRTWLLYVVLIAAFSWMITGRMVRGMTVSVAGRDFVRAARYLGLPGRTVILRHVIPNIASLLLIDAALGVNSAVMTETSLSFLGFGIQPPDVSLGTLLSAGQESATTQPWLFWFAAGLLVLFCLAVNMVGDGLRDALDPTSGAAR
ncbi:MAG TPA: ABC transporter permease [Actinospica sp.]|jgi:ABC-type dipeptide/oligopeptide/nickel transport system permease subunit|nr:ABC transporter permease [Actinospica sp.]